MRYAPYALRAGPYTASKATGLYPLPEAKHDIGISVAIHELV